MLAHMSFLKHGRSHLGQLRALQFVDMARQMINHQLVAGSKDPTLAQAALLIATFETQPHVFHSHARQLASLGHVDSCVRACIPLRLDHGRPGASFDWLDLPRVKDFIIPTSYSDGIGPTPDDPVLASMSYPQLGGLGAPPPSRTPINLKKWSVEPLWSSNPTVAEIQKEEIRRTCWCAMHVAAGCAIFRTVHGRSAPRITVADPTNFTLLLPGEAAFQERNQAHLGKTSIWALTYRSISIWLMVQSGRLSNHDITRALYQARAIEEDTDLFTKHVEMRNAAWAARDWALGTRKLLRDLETSKRHKWFQNLCPVLYAFAHELPGVPRITERPMFAWWYLLQGYTALEFAAMDPVYWTEADTVLDYVYEAFDNVTAAWPCQDLEHLHQVLRAAHQAAKRVLTVEPPPPRPPQDRNGDGWRYNPPPMMWRDLD